MTRILFVCLGNICRSPMAEYIFKQLAADAGRAAEFEVASAGTSDEEEGNGLYYAARDKLRAEGVPFGAHRARQMTAEDLAYYDRILVMEERNLRALSRRFGSLPDKVTRLLSLTERDGDVADPWYTRDFDTAFDDILRGCRALLETL